MTLTPTRIYPSTQTSQRPTTTTTACNIQSGPCVTTNTTGGSKDVDTRSGTPASVEVNIFAFLFLLAHSLKDFVGQMWDNCVVFLCGVRVDVLGVVGVRKSEPTRDNRTRISGTQQFFVRQEGASFCESAFYTVLIEGTVRSSFLLL